MSYGYGQSGGYGQSNPYAQQQSNPYAQQQSNPYAQQQPPMYDAPPNRYGNGGGHQQYSDAPAPYESNNEMEMGQMPPAGAPYGVPPAGPNILDECRRINEGVEDIEKSLGRLENAQRRALNDTVTDRSSPAIREIDMLNSEIMAQYRNLLDKMKRIKSMPNAGSDLNQKHIGLADRKLQNSRQKFMQVESSYQKRMREQTERQYRTVNPEATPEEVRQAVEDPNQQVFAQALMNRDRRGESRQVLGAVRDRHEAIQKIERQMIELAELFNDMERMVVEQEPMVQAIETSAEETHTNVHQANTELTTATKSARAARKKKWICFWIVVITLIIIIAVVIIVLAVKGVFSSNKSNNPAPAKRSIEGEVYGLVQRSLESSGVAERLLHN